MLAYSEYKTLLLLSLAFFLVRCLFLRKNLIFGSVVSIGLLTWGIIIFWHLPQETLFMASEESFIFESDSSTLKINGDRVQVYGHVYKNNKKENIVLFYTLHSFEEKEMWKAQKTSQRYKVKGALSMPKTSRSIHEFDYTSFLKRKNVFWVLEAESIQDIGKSSSFVSMIRERLLLSIERKVRGRTGIYLKALFLGDKREFGEEALLSFRQLGLIHLFSISGLHVYFLGGLFSYFLLRIGLTKENTTFFTLLFLVFYGSILGWTTSIFRSVTQKGISEWGNHFNKRWTTLDCWSFSIIFSVWLRPLYLFEAGFQLSYGLSFLLIFLSQSTWFKTKPKAKQGIYSTLFLFLFSIPIVSYHFFDIQFIGLLLNALFIPFFSLILLPLLLIIWCMAFFVSGSASFQFVLKGINGILLSMEEMALVFSTTGWGTMTTGRLPHTGYMVLVCLLIIGILLVEKRKVTLVRACSLVVLSICVLNFQRYSPTGSVIMLDVGQSEAIFIKEPFGKGHYLIDTGGSYSFPKEEWKEQEKPYSLAKSVVLPFLKSQGVSSLNEVILTHSHIDHTGTLTELSQNLLIQKAFAPPGTWNHPGMQESIQSMRTKQTEIIAVSAEESSHRKIGPGLSILLPVNIGDGGNNDSLVLYGKIGSDTWLFTGDIEEESENKLMKMYPLLRTDILKVAHHGSRTSTQEAFLTQTKPKVALISHGKKNTYGHPHKEVLENLQKAETQIWQTGKHGTISYTYRGKKGKFDAMSTHSR